jgi:hypothetical protein
VAHDTTSQGRPSSDLVVKARVEAMASSYTNKTAGKG